MPAIPRSLNLLPQSEFDASTWGRFLKWALSSGRYIIILTELVVIIAFLSKFKLDRDLSDLTVKISGKKNVLATLAPGEKTFRNTWAKLIAAGSLLDMQVPLSDIWIEIDKSTPVGLAFSQEVITPTDVTMTATATTESIMGEFLKRNGNNPRWKGVDLSNVTWDPQVGVKFTVKLSL